MHRRTIVAIAVIAALAALPAASQQGKNAPTNLYIDVSTHNMAGMPDMGGMMSGLGGFMARRMGGAEMSKPTYPTTQGIGGLTGQYLDIALHNGLKPGAEAQDLVPGGLNLGKSLTLIPIDPSKSASDKGEIGQGQGKIPDVEVRISEYWGCGASVRPGQPKVATFKVKGGTLAGQGGAKRGVQGMDFKATGSLSKGLFAPDRDIDVKPGYVYWPNRTSGKQVPSGARLSGDHKIVGDGIPDSMQFQVQQSSDFMPKIALRSQGEMSDAIGLSWPMVDRARAYFITGMHMQMTGDNSYSMVTWSSADVAGAGSDLHAFLTGSYIDKWLKQKVLLPSGTTNCTIPRGIFASTSGSKGAMPGMLMMTAFGPESWITYPPKPADAKQPWNPEWSVRLRAKSTATAILGLDLGNLQQMDRGEDDEQQPQQKPSMKGLLKGILGG